MLTKHRGEDKWSRDTPGNESFLHCYIEKLNMSFPFFLLTKVHDFTIKFYYHIGIILNYPLLKEGHLFVSQIPRPLK